MRTIDWNDESKSVVMIDQTLLPVELNVIECKNLASLCEAIRSLRVRGAPALAAAGGFGMALAVTLSSADTMEKLLNDLKVAASTLIATRPTAVNLAWAVKRVLKATEDSYDLESIKDIVIFEAIRIADEDVEINKAIGKYGQKLLDDGDTVMTHCNAGRMACVDWGTALGVIRSAVEKGKEINVIACETRPLNQGGRITTWELMQDNIPVKLITDSMSGHVMRHGMVDKMIVGADRITQDVVFNKIGTYTHSIVAREHEIPFYVAAPVSTFDPNGWEDTVTIEQRDADELRYIGDVQIAPKNVDVYNPAFDATPMENITALITEKGIFEPPVLIDEILA
ncbi:MAG: S-methyl-5-thioribose-1-phosphate isomerase [Methanococcoides sp.]|uniref:Putative methylthioribose-1-phosphate isomerase n=1 Tax=Methanococcoides seepicolus TaxID=2828780 RepID=A0A9E4ZE09_9EURY|nr:S-methyl-5-thioribose-1-phosphate isomerase [Methanococcoides seepicolus]MCM1985418.1 S-methyl-5-thioribose-1-phosphate isomerase [Methanococcoides seepicolus]NOQ48466.1 S-methyl-5-thioribose-1-phosphate isomerase [Methanococcoides sp.]